MRAKENLGTRRHGEHIIGRLRGGCVVYYPLLVGKYYKNVMGGLLPLSRPNGRTF